MVCETVSFKSLGLDIGEMRKSSRAFSERGAGGKIKKAGQYEGDFKDFFKTRAVKYQKDLLGPTRYQLWKSGEVSWDDMVDVNGDLVLLKKDKRGGYDGLVP